MFKIKYTIIYTNTYLDKDISWLGTTCESEETAYEIASRMCQEVQDTMPHLDFIILAHAHNWKTIFNDEEL